MIDLLYAPFRRWSEQGTVWIISDTHFGDKELAAGINGRPSDEELLKLINSKVGRKDTLVHLGDVGDIEFARRLKGYKVLICGNHDAGHTVYNEIFDEVYSGPLMISEKIILSHEPIDIPWAYNIHGHDHSKTNPSGERHYNVCCDVIGYEPLHFNSFVKLGKFKKVQSIHRATIDKATEKKGLRIKNKVKRDPPDGGFYG